MRRRHQRRAVGGAVGGAVQEPSDEPSPTEPALPKILTAKNNAELAAILTQGDNCDPSIARFAKKFAGKTIQFDGSVSAFASHGDYDTRFDILVGPGDRGPNTATGRRSSSRTSTSFPT